MFENYTVEIFPPDPLAPPNDRHGQAGRDLSLAPGTLVFSADNHIELAEDIWYENFPAQLKEKAPRIWQVNGVTHIGAGHKSLLPEAYSAVFEPYGRVAGFNSNNMDARMRDLEDEGIAKELAFPNSVLAGMFNFSPASLYEITDPGDREVPKVAFT